MSFSGSVFRLAVLNSHPIQYFGPLYRRLAVDPQIDLTVYFCSRQGLEQYVDPGFGREVKWDVPLLEGYKSKFLPNLVREQGVGGFTSLINPSVLTELRREKYDALWVHGHNYVTYLLAIAAAKSVGTRVFMRSETHLLLDRSPMKRALRRPLMKGLYRLCDAVLPIGSRNAEFYRFHGVPANRMFPVPYTVDNDYFMKNADVHRANKAVVREELGLPAAVPLILFASKLIDRKRPMDLLRAYEQLQRDGVQAALVFVGSGPEEGALQEYTREHDLREVYFLGFRNQSELPKFYAVADVFVLPSEDEPWGLIVNEVMCAGCAVVVAEEIGAAADLVQEGHTGFVFPAGDVDALARHLRALVADPALRKMLGENGRARMYDWSFEQCVGGVRAALAGAGGE